MKSTLKDIFIFLVILLTIALIARFYFLKPNENPPNPPVTGYTIKEINFPSNSNGYADDNETNDLNKGTEQNSTIQDNFSFSEKYHWGHMPLTYVFTSRCAQLQIEDFNLAFSELTRLTNGTVSFQSIDNIDSADIRINCTDRIGEIEYDSDYSYETFGETIPWIYNNTQVFAYADITITKSNSKRGWYPLTELHEILHAFGYEHRDKLFSIMSHSFNTRDTYELYGEQIKDRAVDQEIIQGLKETYR